MVEGEGKWVEKKEKVLKRKGVQKVKEENMKVC